MMVRCLLLFAALVVAGLCAPSTVNYVPMFDFDINLLRTDARLMVMHFVDGQWIPINVTDDDWAWMKDDPSYKKNPNLDFYRQYSDEEGYDTFKNQIIRAIQNPDNFGSAFLLWKNHVMHGVPFFMITARSHFPESMRDGMETLIRKTFNPSELDAMRQNFMDAGRIYGLEPTKGWWGEAYCNGDNIIRNFMYGCEFFSVSSPYWAFRNNCSKVEYCKAMVVRSLVPYAVAFERAAQARGESQLSVMSFYDDTKENVDAVEDEMKMLAVEHPEICFRVYDTHDTKKYVQIDINAACQGVDPGKDWQSSDFHSLHKNTAHVKLYH